MKSILHIANDFCGSTVYTQLIQSLEHIPGTPKQIVYTAIRDSNLVGKNSPKKLSTLRIKIYYSAILSLWTRINFFEKRRRVYQDCLKKVDCSEIVLVHAHTWFSDGVIALQLYKEYKIPYVVTIRNTDVNVFLKYMLHLRVLGREILLHAQKIIFISGAHRKRVIQNVWLKKILPSISQKIEVIPNGIDSFWLKNTHCTLTPHGIDDSWQLVYVGNFTKNKNVPKLMKAVLNLNQNGRHAVLHIVGGRGADEKRIKQLAKKAPDIFYLHGIIRDKVELQSLFRKSHIFTMPSLHETFGLVYVEALTQGLPVLYTEGEGIDGFFSSKYGVKCNPNSISSIMAALQYLISNYETFSIDSDFLKLHFDWNKIAQYYLNNIYDV